MAALLRDAGCEVRLIDATAERLSIDDVIARLDREGFRPTLIVFPEHDADARRRRRGDRASSSAHFGAPMFCFGPHASTTPAESMQRAPDVDGMFVGEPEDGADCARRARLARSPRTKSRA